MAAIALFLATETLFFGWLRQLAASVDRSTHNGTGGFSLKNPDPQISTTVATTQQEPLCVCSVCVFGHCNTMSEIFYVIPRSLTLLFADASVR